MLDADVVTSLVQKLKAGGKPSVLAREFGISRMTLHRYRTRAVGAEAELMQRIVAELYAERLEGVVIDGVPLNETSGDFDLECEFTLCCDDGARLKVQGWAVDATVLES